MLLVCTWAGCGREFVLCRRCYVGQRYCSGECLGQARREQHRRAQHSYAQTQNGRERRAAASASYRERRGQHGAGGDECSLPAHTQAEHGPGSWATAPGAGYGLLDAVQTVVGEASRDLQRACETTTAEPGLVAAIELPVSIAVADDSPIESSDTKVCGLQGVARIDEPQGGKPRRRRVIDRTLPRVILQSYRLDMTGRCQRCGYVGMLFSRQQALGDGT